MYFKLSTFMVSVCRFRAYEDLKQRKKEANEQAKIAHAQEEQNRVLGLSKSKTKFVPPRVPFNIDISTIGASLQLNNFQYVYSVLYAETSKNKDKDRKYKDFHSGLQLLT